MGLIRDGLAFIDAGFASIGDICQHPFRKFAGSCKISVSAGDQGRWVEGGGGGGGNDLKLMPTRSFLYRIQALTPTPHRHQPLYHTQALTPISLTSYLIPINNIYIYITYRRQLLYRIQALIPISHTGEPAKCLLANSLIKKLLLLLPPPPPPPPLPPPPPRPPPHIAYR